MGNTQPADTDLEARAKRIGNTIRDAREAQGISQGKLAKRIGIKQASLSNIESGKTKQSVHLSIIERALGLPLGTLTVDGSPNGIPRKCPVYYTRPGDDGHLLLVPDSIETIDAPAPLACVKDAFGVCIYDDAMAPVYKPGDTVFVHPYHPPIIGADVVIASTSPDDMRLYVGELSGQTATEWTILQYKRNERITLRKAEWGRCGRIVTKYNRV